jgi:hypothetical protein
MTSPEAPWHERCGTGDMKTTAATLASALAFATVVSLSGCATRAAGEAMDPTDEVSSLQGTCPNLVFSVDGMRVTTDAATRFEDGSCLEVVNGRGVEVEGVARDGILYASEIDLD